MKKLKTLFVPLMACSFLVGCGGGSTPDPETLTFSVTESSVVCKDKKAVVYLDWTPNDHSLEFTNFNFTYSGITIDKVAAKDPTARPAEVTITFEEDLKTDITGTLNFHYKDKTAKTEGDGKVEGINIVHTQPTPVVVDGAIDLTYMRMNAGKGSQVKFNYKCTVPDNDLKVYWGDGTVNNSNEHTYNKPGRYSIYITGHIDEIALVDETGTLIAPSNDDILSIIFSRHVTTIPKYAFKFGTPYGTLNSVLLSPYVTTIGSEAFNVNRTEYYCFKDKRGDGWAEDCFVEPKSVTEGLGLYLEESTKILYAVYDDGYSYFASVYICCDLKLENAFIKDEITINNKKTYPVTSIWNSAFYEMPTLKSVVIPGSVKSIESHVFVDCVNLSNVTLNDGLEAIRENAFANTAIKKIKIPSTIKNIDQFAFNSKQLEEVEFNDSEDAKEFKLNMFVFGGCPNIKTLKLGEGLTTIGQYSLKDLAVTEIKIPSTVKNIEMYAINDCNSLEIIDATGYTSDGEIPSVNNKCFYFANRGKTVTIKIANGLTKENFTDKNWPSEDDSTVPTKFVYENIQ